MSFVGEAPFHYSLSWLPEVVDIARLKEHVDSQKFSATLSQWICLTPKLHALRDDFFSTHNASKMCLFSDKWGSLSYQASKSLKTTYLNSAKLIIEALKAITSKGWSRTEMHSGTPCSIIWGVTESPDLLHIDLEKIVESSEKQLDESLLSKTNLLFLKSLAKKMLYLHEVSSDSSINVFNFFEILNQGYFPRSFLEENKAIIHDCVVKASTAYNKFLATLHWSAMIETPKVIGYHATPSSHVAYSYAVRAVVQRILGSMQLPKNFYFLRSPLNPKFNFMDLERLIELHGRMYLNHNTHDVLPQKAARLFIKSVFIKPLMLKDEARILENTKKILFYICEICFAKNLEATINRYCIALSMILGFSINQAKVAELVSTPFDDFSLEENRVKLLKAFHSGSIVTINDGEIEVGSIVCSLNYSLAQNAIDDGESTLKVFFKNRDISYGTDQIRKSLSDFLIEVGYDDSVTDNVLKVAQSLFHDPVILQISELYSSERVDYDAQIYSALPFGIRDLKTTYREVHRTRGGNILTADHLGDYSDNQLRLICDNATTLNPWGGYKMCIFHRDTMSDAYPEEKMAKLQAYIDKLSIDKEKSADFRMRLIKTWSLPHSRL